MGRTSNYGRFYVLFGKNVAQAREKLNMTQEQLASKMQLTRASISNVELGKQRVLAHQLGEFANYLGVSLNELVPKFEESNRKKDTVKDTIEKKLLEIADDKSVEVMLQKISQEITKGG